VSAPLTIEKFKPSYGGSDLFVWQQAQAYAERQFLVHPNVSAFRLEVPYASGVRVEEFVLGSCAAQETTVSLMEAWAVKVQADADVAAVRARKLFEGWATGDDKEAGGDDESVGG